MCQKCIINYEPTSLESQDANHVVDIVFLSKFIVQMSFFSFIKKIVRDLEL